MKKINSKKITSVLCIVLVLLFSSCGTQKKSNSSSSTTVSTSETTTFSTEPTTTTVEPTTNIEETFDKSLNNYISKMTTEEKVGQMFYVRCPNTNGLEQINQYHIGGYILLEKTLKIKLRKK